MHCKISSQVTLSSFLAKEWPVVTLVLTKVISLNLEASKYSFFNVFISFLVARIDT